MTRYWLMKSEPDAYSIDDMEKDKRCHWDGIRNYQARNFMRDEMRIGDLALFYHSNAKPPGIVGVIRICKEAYTDHTAQNPKSKYYDPKATTDKPIWMMVDVEFVERFHTLISLPSLKEDPALDGMLLLKKGSRLSIQPVNKTHFDHILQKGKAN